MIVILSQLAESCVRNRVWLASLGAAALINAVLFWLASIAPMGHLPGGKSATRETPVEIVMRRRIPPPPDLSAFEDPAVIFPPRARRVWGKSRASPKSEAGGWGAASAVSGWGHALPGLNLSLSPCDPADRETLSKPECAGPQDWLRADRDASDLLGPETQGLTLDEVAIARGWIKAKPRTGQDALASQTDTTLPQSIFQDAPFPPHAIERTAGP